MSTRVLTTVVNNPNVIVDPFGTDNINFPPTSIKASLTARVWTGVNYTAVGGIGGALLGICIVKYANKDIAEENEGPLSYVSKPIVLISSIIGAALGGCYSLYRDHYVHFQLQTNFVGKPSQARTVIMQKANTVFKAYAVKKCPNAPGICDTIFTYNLYIYPVKAGDGQIYEHAEICRFLNENYPAAVAAYQRKIQLSPNDPTLLPPSSSPVASGNVKLDELKFHHATMIK